MLGSQIAIAQPATKPKVYPTPTEIVAAAPAADWADIAVDELLVMDLAPDAKGQARRVIIQLMPAPFSQGWVGNIRKLAAAHWWDGTSINRAQDNYVVQWGDPNSDDPKLAKQLPEGLVKVPEDRYVLSLFELVAKAALKPTATARQRESWRNYASLCHFDVKRIPQTPCPVIKDQDEHSGLTYASSEFVYKGWAFASDYNTQWPTHCYGMVGVGRDLPPDTGTGAELYVVIGQAPRQLDRNIALVGRVVEGMENLSTLPRGHGPLGFYDMAKGDERVPILSVRLASALPAADQPHLQYLSTESASFAKYVDARANRRDPFYIQPAGGVDICNVPVPVRQKP
jgi:peptidylprolyl isomerase